MSKEVVKKDPVAEIQQVNEIVAALMKQPHYKKMGADGVFAVISMAKSLGIDPLQAINGGLYPVQGKVEMTSQTMNQVIRQSGHSIKKDPDSNDEVCILHGRRADTGDTWTVSFSYSEAKRAGIARAGGPWDKYRQDMLFARALTRLARQLFPDVIRGCYVREHGQSEIEPEIDILEPAQTLLDEDHLELLEDILQGHEELKVQVLERIKNVFGADSLSELPADAFEPLYDWVKRQVEKPVEAPYPGVEEESA